MQLFVQNPVEQSKQKLWVFLTIPKLGKDGIEDKRSQTLVVDGRVLRIPF